MAPWRQVVHLTQLCLTIKIKELLLDDHQKLGCLTWIMFDSNCLNKILFELISWPKLCSINVKFDAKDYLFTYQDLNIKYLIPPWVD